MEWSMIIELNWNKFEWDRNVQHFQVWVSCLFATVAMVAVFIEFFFELREKKVTDTDNIGKQASECSYKHRLVIAISRWQSLIGMA